MSSFDRRRFLTVALALPLGACGFRPAYGPGGPADVLRGRIEFAPPHDRLGFDLVARLEERLGRTRDPRYRLDYTIQTHDAGVGITTSNAITRYDVVGSVAFTLRDIAGGKVAASGKVDSFTSYSAAGSTVSTLTDESAARARLMRILADQIVTRLIADAAGGLP